MKIFKNKFFIVILCVLLQIALIFGAAGWGLSLLSGEEIDCTAVAAQYNASVPDVSGLFRLKARPLATTMIQSLDKKLSSFVVSADIESSIYSDSTATAIAKLWCSAYSVDFYAADFSVLESEYPAAYSYLTAVKEKGGSWDDVETVPFGITAGDKNAFITACGTIGTFSGDLLSGSVEQAGQMYNDILVPILESLHTGEMPDIVSFILQTKLDSRECMEFIIEKLVSVVDPFKAAPVSYLFEMLPDLITTYNNATAYVQRKGLNLTLPELKPLIDSVFKALELEGKAFDIDYIAKLGTATVVHSGRTGKQRVYISGDKESIFLYLSDYLAGLIISETNLLDSIF